MDLTSLPQKSTKWLIAFALLASVGAGDLARAYANQSSTLVFVDSSSNTPDAESNEFSQTLNALRPEGTVVVKQQKTSQPDNSLRNGQETPPNQPNTLKMQPTRVAQQQPQTTDAAKTTQPNKATPIALKIRQPDQIVRVTSRPTSDASSPVQVAKHQETVIPTANDDPVVQLLLDANKLSKRASTNQDYTKVVNQCANAIRQGATPEHRRFARQLASWALNRRGQLRVDNAENQLADVDFGTALDYNPNNWRALHNRGVSFAQNGQFAQAFDDFNQVIEMNPQFAKAYANRATLYFQTNDLQSARFDYQRALDYDSQLLAAQVGISRTCQLLGRRDEALAHFGKAIKLEPTSANIVCSRGDLLADMGRYREALADYARTIELNPEFAHAYRNGAWLLATCPDSEFRDAENAILGAEQAIEFDYGDRHVALDTLAAALANAGQFEKAAATVQKAMNLAPQGAVAAYRSRLQMYQDQQPFRTQPIDTVAQAAYQVSEK